MRRACAAIALLGLLAGRAPGVQPQGPAVELAESVTRLLEAPFLTPEEGARLRLFHGVWRADDIAAPEARAAAALQRGAVGDAVFGGDAALALDRAEAALVRGEAEEAIQLSGGDASLRAMRLRAEALTALGRFDDARGVLAEAAKEMAAARVDNAAELTFGARALILRQRLVGPGEREGAAGADYQNLAALLARVRDDLDRMYWPALIAEAELLYEKDNPAEAQQAAVAALRLNPGAAEAWLLLGRMAVNAFDFSAAGGIADRLDALGDSIEGGGGPSLYGVIVRARARLRQSDGDGALELVEPMLAKFPRQRELLALRAAASAANYDEDATAAALAALEALAPGSPDGPLLVGCTLSDLRQYEQAAKQLGEARDRMPTWSEPLIELGLLEIQAGRDSAARDALQAAARLDPFNIRAGNSLKLVTDLAAFSVIEGEHFVVRYKPGEDEVLAREMMPLLETMHARVCGDEPGGIDFEPAERTQIELMPDHQWFSVRITGMPQIHTMAASTGPVIAMEAPREGPGHPIGAYDWVRVVRHEYTHTVTLARTKNRIPHWFTEAAAVYLEDALPPPSWMGLLSEALKQDQLFDLQKINIAFVRPERPTDRTMAYAQGHWMYSFIVERFGPRAPLELMDEYARGATQNEAFRQVLGLDERAFLEAFKPWAREQVRGWGLLPPAGQVTLKDLLREMYAQPGAPGAPTMEIVEGWLKQYPDHVEVIELGAKLARQRAGDTVNEDVAGWLEKLAAARPQDPAPRRDLARYYLASDEPARAIPHLEWLDIREQNSPAYAAELARRYGMAGDWALAHAKAERATQVAPYDAEYREIAAAMAIKAARLDDAERHIRALMVLEPDREIHARRLEALQRMR